MKEYLLLGLCLVLLIFGCGGGGGGESSNGNGGVAPAPTPVQKTVYTTSDLIEISKAGSEIILDEVSLRPYKYQTTDGGATYTINFRIKSSENIYGLSIYLYASKVVGRDYYHADISQIRPPSDNSPAADGVAEKNQLPRLLFNTLLGGTLKNPQTNLGELTITSPINNDMIFVVEAYNQTYLSKF